MNEAGTESSSNATTASFRHAHFADERNNSNTLGKWAPMWPVVELPGNVRSSLHGSARRPLGESGAEKGAAEVDAKWFVPDLNLIEEAEVDVVGDPVLLSPRVVLQSAKADEITGIL